jgi:hypothetical protein
MNRAIDWNRLLFIFVIIPLSILAPLLLGNLFCMMISDLLTTSHVYSYTEWFSITPLNWVLGCLVIFLVVKLATLIIALIYKVFDYFCPKKGSK